MISGHHPFINVHNMIEVPMLTQRVKKKYGLLDAETMVAKIGRYDIIIPEHADVERLPTYTGDQATNVRQLWEYHAGLFVDEHAVDNLLERIDRIALEYNQSARAYFAGDRHIGYNCCVMKRALFDRLCEFQFPILFDLERTLTKETLAAYPRLIGYVGEMLFGVFAHHLTTVEHVNVEHKQPLFIDDAKPVT